MELNHPVQPYEGRLRPSPTVLVTSGPASPTLSQSSQRNRRVASNSYAGLAVTAADRLPLTVSMVEPMLPMVASMASSFD